LQNFLIVHGNYLNAKLLGMNQPTTTVIYCPRTHAAFGHASHPFPQILAGGGRVALGTDSLASNPDLNVLAEARFIRRNQPDIPGETLLRMITLWGAEALGWHQETGSLTPGKSADLAVLPLPPNDMLDPHSLIFESSTHADKVMCLGRWLHR
jgi:cytosine/adenosine deaminase-related metal-dependent hydrolase